MSFPPAEDGADGPTADLDDAVALSILGGLLTASDFDSLVNSGRRGEEFPTLSDLLDVERKRIREVLKTAQANPER